jgi:hypothetical protein
MGVTLPGALRTTGAPACTDPDRRVGHRLRAPPPSFTIRGVRRYDRAAGSDEGRVRVGERSDVPAEVLAEIRAICAALPETYEEPAWVGVRWRVRKKTFAHIVMVDDDSTPAFDPVKAALDDQRSSVCIVTFRSQGPELAALRNAGHPFFYAGWGRDVIGMVLDAATDWDEVAELLTESYCVLAPKKLIALVDRPDPPEDGGEGPEDEPER